MRSCVDACQNSCTIPTGEKLRGGSFLFPTEPIVVKLLSAKIDSWVYHNYFCQENQHIHAAIRGMIVDGSNEMLTKLSDQCGLLKSSSPAWSL